jgi:hypothetical protein
MGYCKDGSLPPVVEPRRNLRQPFFSSQTHSLRWFRRSSTTGYGARRKGHGARGITKTVLSPRWLSPVETSGSPIFSSQTHSLRWFRRSSITGYCAGGKGHGAWGIAKTALSPRWLSSVETSGSPIFSSQTHSLRWFRRSSTTGYCAWGIAKTALSPRWLSPVETSGSPFFSSQTHSLRWFRRSSTIGYCGRKTQQSSTYAILSLPPPAQSSVYSLPVVLLLPARA